MSGIQWKKAEKALAEALRRNSLSPSAMLQEAAALDATLPGRQTRCTQAAVDRLLEDFVHFSFLTVHGHSSLYDPARAREILDTLASLRAPELQGDVLHAISRWGDRHEGLMSVNEHADDLREGLMVPLWWRYSSETRLKYLDNHKHRHAPFVNPSPWAGQHFLLEDMMGLHYDYDDDFRREFNRSLERYRDPTGAYS